ncbi:hypothetical protein ACFORL_09200 [Legionella dresdenensis]|uniref:Outer membrane protein beta-barrel domain-containing protein n=1 Tax=Legionella dresdenensis TaxID=450200 RepID=A0ABV8CGY5_9GAMM
MNNKKICALAFALASTASQAGTMGPAYVPERLLFVEGGVSYSHAFYDSYAVFPESRTLITPNGYAINPKRTYPNDFFGGYIGSSIYWPSDWLMNTRYDMYGEKTRRNYTAGTAARLAPTKLSFTLDKVFGDIRTFSYGIGAGAIVETLNEGDFLVVVSADNPSSESIQGRTRIDPLVEGFAMYRFDNGFGIKFNAGYQIPVNSKFGSGDLNLNLGINYAFSI